MEKHGGRVGILFIRMVWDGTIPSHNCHSPVDTSAIKELGICVLLGINSARNVEPTTSDVFSDENPSQSGFEIGFCEPNSHQLSWPLFIQVELSALRNFFVRWCLHWAGLVWDGDCFLCLGVGWRR